MTPKRYENAKYDDVPSDIRKAFEGMKQSRKGIYIHGGIGSGKTHIAYALMNETERVLGVRTMFWNTSELLRELRADMVRHDYDKRYTDERVMKFRGLLFLDDIGAEKLSDWVNETFYLIVNERYNEMIPTVFTSNLTLGELADHVGDRTVSRIVELCDVFELSGGDRRIQ